MENQSDFSSMTSSISEQNICMMVETMETEGSEQKLDDATLDSNESEISTEQFRRGQDLDSTVNKYSLSAVDWSCLSDKEPVFEEGSPGTHNGKQRLSFSHRHDVAVDTAAESAKFQAELLQAAVESEPLPASPWPGDLSPVPVTIMTTPVSQTSNKAEQVIPNAPLPLLKGVALRKGHTNFGDNTYAARLFPNVKRNFRQKTEYTKPPIQQNCSTLTETPVLAKMMSTALEMATMNKVSPLFETMESDVLPAAQKEAVNTNITFVDVIKDVAAPSSPKSVHTVRTYRKCLSEQRQNEIPSKDSKGALERSVSEDISSCRKRKVGTAIPRFEELDPEQATPLREIKSEETNKYSTACLMPNQHTKQTDDIDRQFSEVFQKTSTPIRHRDFQNYGKGALESSICRISGNFSDLEILPPWKRFDLRSPVPIISQTDTTFCHDPFNSEAVSDTRSRIAADRKRSKKSCTLRPDWILSLEEDTKNKMRNESSRKVSVVNKNTRKLTPCMLGVDSLLIPTDPTMSPLEKLAPFTRKSAITPPLYIVHPITGSVKILQQLAKGLHVRCYGIRKTYQTPDASVELMAKFYCEALLQHQKTGFYNLAGYSYGGLVVFEMARLLQQAGKQVAVLIMIDGSPAYVKSQISATRQGLHEDSDPQHVKAVVQSHLLLFFIGMYRPLQEPELVQTMLAEQSSQEDRVAAAVGVTLGTVQVSNQIRGRWLGLKSKIEKSLQNDKVRMGVSHVAQDVISLHRQQKAMAFLQAASIAEQYEVKEDYRFEGNIHLVRIQPMPKHCSSLSTNYNLKELCTGTVHVHYVDGEHESMMESPHVESVIQAVNLALKRIIS